MCGDDDVVALLPSLPDEVKQPEVTVTSYTLLRESHGGPHTLPGLRALPLPGGGTAGAGSAEPVSIALGFSDGMVGCWRLPKWLTDKDAAIMKVAMRTGDHAAVMAAARVASHGPAAETNRCMIKLHASRVHTLYCSHGVEVQADHAVRRKQKQQQQQQKQQQQKQQKKKHRGKGLADIATSGVDSAGVENNASMQDGAGGGRLLVSCGVDGRVVVSRFRLVEKHPEAAAATSATPHGKTKHSSSRSKSPRKRSTRHGGHGHHDDDGGSSRRESRLGSSSSSGGGGGGHHGRRSTKSRLKDKKDRRESRLKDANVDAEPEWDEPAVPSKVVYRANDNSSKPMTQKRLVVCVDLQPVRMITLTQVPALAMLVAMPMPMPMPAAGLHHHQQQHAPTRTELLVLAGGQWCVVSANGAQPRTMSLTKGPRAFVPTHASEVSHRGGEEAVTRKAPLECNTPFVPLTWEKLGSTAIQNWDVAVAHEAQGRPLLLPRPPACQPLLYFADAAGKKRAGPPSPTAGEVGGPNAITGLAKGTGVQAMVQELLRDNADLATRNRRIRETMIKKMNSEGGGGLSPTAAATVVGAPSSPTPSSPYASSPVREERETDSMDDHQPNINVTITGSMLTGSEGGSESSKMGGGIHRKKLSMGENVLAQQDADQVLELPPAPGSTSSSSTVTTAGMFVPRGAGGFGGGFSLPSPFMNLNGSQGGSTIGSGLTLAETLGEMGVQPEGYGGMQAMAHTASFAGMMADSDQARARSSEGGLTLATNASYGYDGDTMRGGVSGSGNPVQVSYQDDPYGVPAQLSKPMTAPISIGGSDMLSAGILGHGKGRQALGAPQQLSARPSTTRMDLKSRGGKQQQQQQQQQQQRRPHTVAPITQTANSGVRLSASANALLGGRGRSGAGGFEDLQIRPSGNLPVRGERATAEKRVREKQLTHTVYDEDALGAARPRTAILTALAAAKSRALPILSPEKKRPGTHSVRAAKSSKEARKLKASLKKAASMPAGGGFSFGGGFGTLEVEVVPNGMRAVEKRKMLTTTTTTIGLADEFSVEYKKSVADQIEFDQEHAHLAFQRNQHTPMGMSAFDGLQEYKAMVMDPTYDTPEGVTVAMLGRGVHTPDSLAHEMSMSAGMGSLYEVDVGVGAQPVTHSQRLEADDDRGADVTGWGGGQPRTGVTTPLTSSFFSLGQTKPHYGEPPAYFTDGGAESKTLDLQQSKQPKQEVRDIVEVEAMAARGELGGEFGDGMFAVEDAGGGDNSAAPPPPAATSTKRKLSKSSSSRPHIIGTDGRVRSSAAAAPSAAAATTTKKHRVYKQRQPREKVVTARRAPFNRDATVGAAGVPIGFSDAQYADAAEVDAVLNDQRLLQAEAVRKEQQARLATLRNVRENLVSKPGEDPRQRATMASTPANDGADQGQDRAVSASAGATRKPLRMNTVSVIAESVPDPGTTEDMVLKERDRFVADAEQGRAMLPVSAQQQLPPGGTGVNARYVKRKVKRLKRPNEDMATYLASLTAGGNGPELNFFLDSTKPKPADPSQFPLPEHEHMLMGDHDEGEGSFDDYEDSDSDGGSDGDGDGGAAHDSDHDDVGAAAAKTQAVAAKKMEEELERKRQREEERRLEEERLEEERRAEEERIRLIEVAKQEKREEVVRRKQELREQKRSAKRVRKKQEQKIPGWDELMKADRATTAAHPVDVSLPVNAAKILAEQQRLMQEEQERKAARAAGAGMTGAEVLVAGEGADDDAVGKVDKQRPQVATVKSSLTVGSYTTETFNDDAQDSFKAALADQLGVDVSMIMLTAIDTSTPEECSNLPLGENPATGRMETLSSGISVSFEITRTFKPTELKQRRQSVLELADGLHAACVGDAAAEAVAGPASSSPGDEAAAADVEVEAAAVAAVAAADEEREDTAAAGEQQAVAATEETEGATDPGQGPSPSPFEDWVTKQMTCLNDMHSNQQTLNSFVEV
jgi:hypothetical protein